jgi:hypothetical protein
MKETKTHAPIVPPIIAPRLGVEEEEGASGWKRLESPVESSSGGDWLSEGAGEISASLVTVTVVLSPSHAVLAVDVNALAAQPCCVMVVLEYTNSHL